MTGTADFGRYHRDGYVVLDAALSPTGVHALREEAVRICRGELCIHFPHKVSELMGGVLAHPAIILALTRLIGPDVKAMQSMLFIRSEGKLGQTWPDGHGGCLR